MINGYVQSQIAGLPVVTGRTQQVSHAHRNLIRLLKTLWELLIQLLEVPQVPGTIDIAGWSISGKITTKNG